MPRGTLSVFPCAEYFFRAIPSQSYLGAEFNFVSQSALFKCVLLERKILAADIRYEKELKMELIKY
jgi:hypothetical protein